MHNIQMHLVQSGDRLLVFVQLQLKSDIQLILFDISPPGCDPLPGLNIHPGAVLQVCLPLPPPGQHLAGYDIILK